MTAHEELINYIMNMTPEQVDKLVNHPTWKAVMDEYKQEQAVDA